MFNIDPSELMLVAIVALVVIGPKDLPRAMRFVGQWVGRARGVARHFRSGFDEMVRQAEMEEMEKKWAAENARIMAEHPPAPPPEEYDDAHYAMTPLPPLPEHGHETGEAADASGPPALPAPDEGAHGGAAAAEQEPPARS
ncbi:Sec-independent protein translocase protein TatB [Sphingomonas sp.]|uniref:Sec-independent protein translocase protein TatB n=1 Tax=Sphingomonas sp. TaxID=28214 RepID=UPI000DB05A40|nr:Sec-independent protein translocase protein TatB [Sphingomonas sp.]PZU11814.1 MAG: twin-arginine translocase subunit TatB [Sphingomonas sp.]